MKGFTLIEVLVAIVIFTAGMLALWGMQMTANRANSFSNKLNEAVSCANEKINELRSNATSSLPSNGVYIDICNCGSYNCIRELMVSDPSSSIPDTKQIDIAVGWGGNGCSSNINNCKHTVEIGTLLTLIQ